MDARPRAPAVPRLQETTLHAAALREQRVADPVRQSRRGLAEVGLRNRNPIEAAPVGAAVARHVQRPARLPDQAEAVAGHRDPERVAVCTDAAARAARWAEWRVCDPPPTARPEPVDRLSHRAGTALSGAERPRAADLCDPQRRWTRRRRSPRRRERRPPVAAVTADPVGPVPEPRFDRAVIRIADPDDRLRGAKDDAPRLPAVAGQLDRSLQAAAECTVRARRPAAAEHALLRIAKCDRVRYERDPRRECVHQADCESGL